MPGLQSIVKAWTKINYDHLEYVAEDKRSRSGGPGSTIADEASLRRPSTTSSTSAGGGGGDGHGATERQKQPWQINQGVNYPENALANASASAIGVGGIGKLFDDASISAGATSAFGLRGGDGNARGTVAHGAGGSSSSFVADRPSTTRKLTQPLHINGALGDGDTDLAKQQQHHPQYYQHHATTRASTQQHHFTKSPPPTLPTPSSYLTSNLSSLTFSLNDENNGMHGVPDTPMQRRLNDDPKPHQLHHRHHISHHDHNKINTNINSDDRRKSEADVISGRRSTAAAVDVTLNQLHQQEHQLYQAINSGGAFKVADNKPNSTTPLTTNKTQLKPPNHHIESTYSPSHSPIGVVRDMGAANDLHRRVMISPQHHHQKRDFGPHTPLQKSSRIQERYPVDVEQQLRGGRSSSLLELFLLEEEQQQLELSTPKTVPEEEGDEEEEEFEDGEARNMMSYHRRRYIMGGPMRGQQPLPNRSRKAFTRNYPLSEDQWMKEWLNHTNQTTATTSSILSGSYDQRLKRNSQSSGSSGTTVTANRSVSIRDRIETTSVSMKMPSYSANATGTNGPSDVMPTDKQQRNMYSIESINPVLSQGGSVSAASTNHCNRCAQMESALLALHADLEYLRGLELQREFVDTGSMAPESNAQTAPTPLPPIDQNKALYQDASNLISTTASSSQSISSAISIGSRGSLASSRFSSIARSRQQQQRRQQQQQLQILQQQQQHHKNNSSPSQINPYMILRDASKRLTDLSTRHQRQVKQSMHDGAFWQNDMHLKLEKFALMCKNLNEEAAYRGNEVKETKAMLDKMTSERNALVSEAEILRAQVKSYVEECAEKSSLREEWEQERIKMMNDKELEIKHCDDIIDEMSRRLELAVDTIESERKLQIMRRSIIFPPSRPQPSSPSLLQHKQSSVDNNTVSNHTASLDSPSKVNEFYFEELNRSKEISAKAQLALQASMAQSASREKELQFRLSMLERELAMRQCEGGISLIGWDDDCSSATNIRHNSSAYLRISRRKSL